MIILSFLFIVCFFFLLQPPLLKAIFNVDPDEVRSLIFKKEDVNAQVSPTVTNICICFLILLLFFGGGPSVQLSLKGLVQLFLSDIVAYRTALHDLPLFFLFLYCIPRQYYIFKWWCLFQNKAVLYSLVLHFKAFLYFYFY